MNRFVLYFVFVFIGLLGMADKVFGQVQIGGGLTFGTGISSLGFNFRGTYEIDEKFMAAPGINFFFRDNSISDVTTSYFSIDLNARYNLIEVGDDLVIYPVGGLNVFNVKQEGATIGIRPRREDGLTLGLDLGIGAQMSTLSNWSYFGEYRITIGGIDQSTITAGVLYGF